MAEPAFACCDLLQSSSARGQDVRRISCPRALQPHTLLMSSTLCTWNSVSPGTYSCPLPSGHSRISSFSWGSCPSRSLEGQVGWSPLPPISASARPAPAPQPEMVPHPSHPQEPFWNQCAKPLLQLLPCTQFTEGQRPTSPQKSCGGATPAPTIHWPLWANRANAPTLTYHHLVSLQVG